MSASLAAGRVASHALRSRDATHVALIRGLVALVWAVALVAVVGGGTTDTSADIPAGAALLIASYPLIDVLASLATARGLGSAGRGLQINAALSSLAVAAIVTTSLAAHVSAVLVAFGAWASVSGAIQFTRAVRNRHHQGHRLPLIVAGGLSTVVGISFIAASSKSTVHLMMFAEYMALGAVLFLLSALRTRRAASAAS